MNNNSSKYSIYFFILGCFGYLLLMVSHISVAYLDFGDGNYLYISRRILQGLVIYNDILSPQPPFHLFLGAILLKIGYILGSPLFLIRVFSILLRISHAVFIYFIARKLFIKENSEPIYSWIPSLSGLVYLFLPIGFWWSRGYQSEPLEILWMLCSFYFFIDFDKKKMIFAGLFSAFAMLTNMTAAPYLLISILFLGIFRRDLVLWFSLPSILFIGLFVSLLQNYTSGMFLQNAILDQVGTYPKENTLNYMLGKIRWIGKIILDLEGPLILTSIIGLFLYIKAIFNSKHLTRNPKLYVFFYMLCTLGSFVFATKGGTVDYIFTIGEPAVALFSVFGVIHILEIYFTTLRQMVKILTVFVFLALFSYPGIRQNSDTLKGKNYELPPETVDAVVSLIRENTQEGELIFSPPYFAFMAERPLVGEFSEQYVWFIKYVNWVRYKEGNPNTIPYLENIGNVMITKKVKIVFINIERGRGQQTGQIQYFRQPVDLYYRPVGQVDMRNETLTIYLPIH